MFPKSSIAPLFFLALASSVNAHAGVTPALGVKGTLTRNDVQRPSTANPCGNVNIAQTLDSSTAIPASANGTFSIDAINFNGGGDGSRSIKTVQVDASGTGKNFVPAKMIVNGDAAPKDDSTQQLTVQLPDGTKCTGGGNKDLCLASFTTTAGFGNCAVVSQGTGAADPASSQPKPGQNKPVRNGAAEGARFAIPADQNPPQSSESGGPKKGDKPKNGDKGKSTTKPADTPARRMVSKRNWSSRRSLAKLE